MIEPSKIIRWELKGKGSSKAAFSWKIPADCPYVEGHFPGNPILPAVAFVDGSYLAIQKLTPRNWKGIKNSKFSGPLRPGDRVELEIEIQNDEAVCVWNKEENGALSRRAELVIRLV